MSKGLFSGTIAGVSSFLIFCLGIIYKVYEDFVYNYSTNIKNTFDITQLKDSMRVGRFFIFIALWILIIISNMLISSIVFNKKDFLNQAGTTTILYLGIVATTFVVIGIVPGLVEIFENTFGTFIVSTPPTAWIYKFTKTFDVFQSNYFKQDDMNIPFKYLLPMFNLRNFNGLFDTIKDTTNTGIIEDETKEVGNNAEPVMNFDFYFDFNRVCRDLSGDDKTTAAEIFKRDLYKICIAKQNAGHFVWVYIASIVTIMTTITLM
mgnify:FL=1